MWVIPESSTVAAWTPPTAGVWYSADGFKIGGTIYKVDGSTCVTISCANGRWSTSTCVNLLAGLGGKGPPRAVGAGTFTNEPRPWVPAVVVK